MDEFQDKQPGNAKNTVLCFLGVVAIAAYTIYLLVLEIEKNYTWRQTGATVVGTQEQDQQKLTVKYKYVVDGKEYEKSVSSELKDKKYDVIKAMAQKQTITIAYEISDPANDDPFYDVRIMIRFGFILFVLPFVVLSLNLFWMAIFKRYLLETWRTSDKSTPSPGGGASLALIGLSLAGCAACAIIDYNWTPTFETGMKIGCGILAFVIIAWALIHQKFVSARLGKSARTAPSPTAKAENIINTLVFTLIILCMTCIVMYPAISPALQSVRFKKVMQPASGYIVASDIRHNQDENPTPVVQYKYFVDGKEYSGNRIDFSSGGSPIGKFKVNAYQANQPVTVYYNPARPRESVLNPNIPESSWYFPMFVQPFIVLLAYLALYFGSLLMARNDFKALRSDDDWPDRIPGWGKVIVEYNKITIFPRSKIRTAIRASVLAYAIMSIVAIFTIAPVILYAVVPIIPACQATFAAMILLGTTIFICRLIFDPPKTVTIFDLREKAMVLRTGKQDIRLPFAEIKSIDMCKLKHDEIWGWISQMAWPIILLEAKTTSGKNVYIRALLNIFGEDRTVQIADAAKRLISSVVKAESGKDSSASEEKTANDSPAKLNIPTSVARAIIRLVAGGEKYSSIS